MELIAQGAEAKLYKKGKVLLKERTKKSYRIAEIDDRLRSARTRRESKVLEKLAQLEFPAPRLIQQDEKREIQMDFIEGPKVRDISEKSDYVALSKEIGRKIAILHNNQIIHGDLTTSNMILNSEIYFIDFGLSFFSDRIEDKAVDLHLFRQAVESKHYTIWEVCFKSFLAEYKKNARDSKEILSRLDEVEKRGRNKH